MAGGEIAELVPGFPGVTCPVQASMTTGAAGDHGVVANGFTGASGARSRCGHRLTTASSGRRSGICSATPGRDCVGGVVSAAQQGMQADMSARRRRSITPTGQSLWYTRGHGAVWRPARPVGSLSAPSFLGPLAGISRRDGSSIRPSTAETFRPHFFYIYLPHLDYAAQRTGPESAAADQAVADLDEQIGRLVEGFRKAYDGEKLIWLAAGEYPILPVSHVTYPNRVLREEGCSRSRRRTTAKWSTSRPAGRGRWWITSCRISCPGCRCRSGRRVADVGGQPGIADVLAGINSAAILDHPRSGEVVLVSKPDSWQAYYYWLADDRPAWARTVDIHRKPGYDPVTVLRRGHQERAAGCARIRLARRSGGGEPPADRATGHAAESVSAGPTSRHRMFRIVLEAFGLKMLAR